MTLPCDRQSPESAKAWRDYIETKLTDRCDFNVLVKNEWRHKIVIRDFGQPFKTNSCSISIGGYTYSKIKSTIEDVNGVSLRSAIATTFHLALGAFGYGSQTVVSYLKLDNKRPWKILSCVPLLIDHDKLSTKLSIEAMQAVEKSLNQAEFFVDDNSLLNCGLFDAALALVDNEFDTPTTSSIPLAGYVCDEGSHLQFNISYASDLFDKDVVSGFLDVLREILQAIAIDSSQAVGKISLTSEAQMQQLLAWNSTDGEFPHWIMLHELVDMATQRTPHELAVVSVQQNLSYAELDVLAYRIASYVQISCANQKEKLIALYLDKSYLVIAAMLGIWKAGKAFLPLDPKHPSSHVRLVLKDSKAVFIITNGYYKERLTKILNNELSLQTHDIEDMIRHENALSTLFLRNKCKTMSGDTAYVTYTSGTTGLPKGVPKSHRSVVNSITDLSVRYSMLEPCTERVLLFASYVFEPFMRQMLIALINSQTLVVLPDDVRKDVDLFSQFMKKHCITYLNGTGSVLQNFDLTGLKHLKRILLVGEELTESSLKQLRNQFNGEIINEYAFTEAAFVTAIKVFSPNTNMRSDRSVGRCLRNVKCYVLSPKLKQVPIGAIGELYIGGEGVASGYINRVELTRQKFLSNPYQTKTEKALGRNATIYKTGDLARVLRNGEFEYMGRNDFQLKINGIRVEPGEIESKTMKFPGVKKCVVIPNQSSAGPKHLIGYFVAEPNVAISEDDLLRHLEKELIRVMLPSRMVQLSRFPTNINGKVDWRQLPNVEHKISSFSSTKPVPCSHGQKGTIWNTVQAIWAEALKLSTELIDEEADFFRLGGNSISCLLVSANIRKRLKIHLDVDEIFQFRSLKDLTDLLFERLQIHSNSSLTFHLSQQEGITRKNEFRANNLHQALMYHDIKEADDSYVSQIVYKYNCSLNHSLLKQAWESALIHYPGLRVCFFWDKEPLQIVRDKNLILPWTFYDLSLTVSDSEAESKIDAIQKADRLKRFDLTTAPLFFISFVQLPEKKCLLLFNYHHIILDGWSLRILFDKVHSMYLSLVEGKTFKTKEDVAFLEAQVYWTEHIHDSTKFWQNKVNQISERCDFTGLLNEASRKIDLAAYNKVLFHKEIALQLDAAKMSEVKQVCSENGITLHSILQFCWHTALSAFGGGHDTIVGTIVSGRNIPVNGIERSVGLFINTVPIIVSHKRNQNDTILYQIVALQNAVNCAIKNCVVEIGQLRINSLKRSLFDSLFVLENYPSLLHNTEMCRHYQQLQPEILLEIDKVDHPLAIVIKEVNKMLTFTVWYAGELFEEQALTSLLESMKGILFQLVENIHVRPQDLQLYSEEHRDLLQSWNQTNAVFDSSTTLNKIFENISSKWPNELALVYMETQLTYSQLNFIANKLANQIVMQVPIKPNDLIALCLDKDEKQVFAILGVWKSGAAYVPIDPSFPDQRIEYMLHDTQACVIVANRDYRSRLSKLKLPYQSILDIEIVGTECSTKPVSVSTNSTDLAYAIYTSGTTGKPKAVLVNHKGVINLHESLSKTFSLNRSQGRQTFLSFSNYVFDHFVENMTNAILNGQKLLVLNDHMRNDEDGLLNYIKKNSVTYLSGTPSVLSTYNFHNASSLTRIDAVGEDFTEAAFKRIQNSYGGTIINGYGPTEVSITTHKRIYPPGDFRQNKSIGYPVANTTCYILDGLMRQVPIGGVGELYLGGVGVCIGYLNQTDLTAKSFLANPFQSSEEKNDNENERIFKTGDLARYLPNGEVECLGRCDTQVKIRGQRIELEEVQNVLSSYPGVKQSVVVVRETGHERKAFEKVLVGFYTSQKTLAEKDIKRFMRTKLTSAATPARLIPIAKIPVTVNGKLDSKRLPFADFSQFGAIDYCSANSSVDIRVCRIWSEILNVSVEAISLTDDFFALGGDSIRAIVLAQAIRTEFQVSFQISDVFTNVTVSEQTDAIRSFQHGSDSFDENKTYTVATSDTFTAPISFAQQRLLFIAELEQGSSAYNVAICLKSNSNVCSFSDINNAVRCVVQKHSALRTLFRKNSCGLFEQHVLSSSQALELLLIKNEIIENVLELDRAIVANERHIFDLAEELPIKVDMYRIPSHSNKLYISIVIHHLCFDGWSLRILLKDLQSFASGKETLTQMYTSYADYAALQTRMFRDDQKTKLTDFWRQYLRGISECNSLRADFMRPMQFDYLGQELPFFINCRTTTALLEMAKTCRVSLYSLLLSCYCLTISSFTNQTDIVVGTPFADRGMPKFENVIGLFANLLVLRVSIDTAFTIQDFVRSVSKTVINAQIHGSMPFGEVVRCTEIAHDTSRNPIIQLVFTLEDNLALYSAEYFSPYKPNNNGSTLTKFDATCTVFHNNDGLSGIFTYATSVFSKDTARQVVQVFTCIVNEFTKLFPEQHVKCVKDVQIVPSTTAAPVPIPTEFAAEDEWQPVPINKLFEKIASQNPLLNAIIFEETKTSYTELNNMATLLCNNLRSITLLDPNDFVALILEKGVLMIVAILATWKAGAAYIPIDIDTPNERIAFMLSDMPVGAVLTHRSHYARVKELAITSQTVTIEDICSRDVSSPATAPVSIPCTSLAYAIYTSGTTGCPKAVLVEHISLFSFYQSLKQRFPHLYKASEKILFLSNFSFDFSLEQIVLSILCGNTLVITNKSLQSSQFYDVLNQHELSYISGTPTQIHQIDLSRLKCLKTVLVAGETFQRHHFEKIQRTYQGALYSAYGTTETTVYNIVKRCNIDECLNDCLGDPLWNTGLKVVGKWFQQVPRGAVGELCIAGVCVSRGYMNRAELCHKKFLKYSHYSQGAKNFAQRLFRTGDIVQVTHDGTLKYIGREDGQVKIRGIRVELGEIEAVLGSYPGVKQCAVLCSSTNNEQRLVGYVVADKIVQYDEVVNFMRKKLLHSMVPYQLIYLKNSLPINSSGKLDTKALRSIKTESSNIDVTYTPPRNRMDELLCHLWQSQLKNIRIGIDHNFFTCGGDSISAMMLTSAMQNQLEQNINVKCLFDFSTIRQLVDNVFRNNFTNKNLIASPKIATGLFPLLPIQEWFFSLNMAAPHHFNQNFAIHTPPLCLENLKKALFVIANHHASFSLRYSQTAQAIRQYYSKKVDKNDVRLHVANVADLTNADLHVRLKEWQSNFNLQDGPLWCAAYLYGFPDGSARIWFAMHHLIVDSVSWLILARDIEMAYNGKKLHHYGNAFSDWVGAVSNYQCNESEREHWMTISKLVVSTSFFEQFSAQKVSSRSTFQLSHKNTQAILTNCSRAYETQITDLLLTALASGFRSITGMKQSYITVESHGRPPTCELDISGTVGWFTSMYPFVAYSFDDLGESIIATKESRKRVLNQGVGYGALFGAYGTEKAPLPPISFNYLGQLNSITHLDQQSNFSWFLDPTMCGIDKNKSDQLSSIFLVDITAYCDGHQMFFTIDSRLPEQNTQTMVSTFKDYLHQIILHTLQIKRPALAQNTFVPYIAANESTDGPTLFVLPPGEGGAESYLNNIAKHLHYGQHIFFNNIHLVQPMKSFEKLAEYYIKEIKQIQPNGSYNLLGWSFGGVLSLEIALQLTKLSCHVQNLILIDPYFEVLHSSSEIGFASVDNILDSINYYYVPNRNHLKRFQEHNNLILLFKAGRVNDVFNDSMQKQLFEYYHQSEFNNLERLVSPNKIELVIMNNDTHHSWVNNQQQVVNICKRISSALKKCEPKT